MIHKNNEMIFMLPVSCASFSQTYSINKIYIYGSVSNLVPLVNLKIAGKWMFIPLKMVLIGIDPYPYIYTNYYPMNIPPCIASPSTSPRDPRDPRDFDQALAPGWSGGLPRPERQGLERLVLPRWFTKHGETCFWIQNFGCADESFWTQKK